MARKKETVMGVSVGAPRVTGYALWLAASRLALPLILGLVAFDVVVWWLADAIWNICIGLWCWL